MAGRASVQATRKYLPRALALSRNDTTVDEKEYAKTSSPGGIRSNARSAIGGGAFAQSALNLSRCFLTAGSHTLNCRLFGCCKEDRVAKMEQGGHCWLRFYESLRCACDALLEFSDTQLIIFISYRLKYGDGAEGDQPLPKVDRLE